MKICMCLCFRLTSRPVTGLLAEEKGLLEAINMKKDTAKVSSLSQACISPAIEDQEQDNTRGGGTKRLKDRPLSLLNQKKIKQECCWPFVSLFPPHFVTIFSQIPCQTLAPLPFFSLLHLHFPLLWLPPSSSENATSWFPPLPQASLYPFLSLLSLNSSEYLSFRPSFLPLHFALSN